MPRITKLEWHKIAGRSGSVELPNGEDLFLTGPNGVGKSTLLRKLDEAADEALRRGETTVSRYRRALSEPEPVLGDRGLAERYLNDHSWVEPSFDESPKVAWGFRRFHVFFRPARARAAVESVDGPKRLERYEKPLPSAGFAEDFMQLLVNERVQAGLVEEASEKREILEWLGHVEATLRDLLQVDAFSLHFDRRRFRYAPRIGDVDVDFNELSDGHWALLDLYLNLILRARLGVTSGSPSKSDGGLVLLDEPELHLHPSLVERLLPSLKRAFPNYQWIVATHSPIVLASSDGIVVDMETGDTLETSRYRGLSYGDIYESHFDITDVDLQTTGKLQALSRAVADHDPSARALLAELDEVDHEVVHQARLLRAKGQL